MGSVAVEVMNIGSMLNNRIAQHQLHESFFDHTQSHFPLIKHEPMDRSVSPHGSEHSHYSTSHMARSYHSPNAMHTPMGIPNHMQSSMQLPSFPDMPNMANMTSMPTMPTMPTQHLQQPPPPQPSTKSYPCSTCGKQFARRSDLARHGKP